MAEMVGDNIVLDPKFHVEFDFATVWGRRALWEALPMQNGFASYFAWCKMGNIRRPFQPISVINIAQLGFRKEVLVLVWSRGFGS